MWSYLMWFTALTIKLYLHRWVGFQFPINASHEQRQTSHLIYTFRFWQEKWGFVRDLFLLQLLGRHYLIMHCMHCSSCCQLTGIKKINRTATFAGVHSFLLGWRINWGGIIRDVESLSLCCYVGRERGCWWIMQRICGVNPDSGLANSNIGLAGQSHGKVWRGESSLTKCVIMWHWIWTPVQLEDERWQVDNKKMQWPRIWQKSRSWSWITLHCIVSLDSSLIINYLYLYFKCTMGE